MSWIEYLLREREDKRKRIYALQIGSARLHLTVDGVQTDATQEHLEMLKSNVTEIEQILTDEGVPFDA